MKINLPEQQDSSYVVAVSGGVDSMVLLDIMRREVGEKRILAAYFNHRQRGKLEVEEDIQVISAYCKEFAIRLEVGEYNGSARDEASLRRARYEFLKDIQKNNNYNAIVTAHHKDDLLETTIINILRGTKGQGLYSIQNTEQLVRPLLGVSKVDLLKYAREHAIDWHEDSTNQDQSLLRNYVRHTILPQIPSEARVELEGRIHRQAAINKKIESDVGDLVVTLLTVKNSTTHLLQRRAFILLPHSVSLVLLKEAVEGTGATLDVTENVLQKAVTFCKTAQLGASLDISRQLRLKLSDKHIELLKAA